MDFNLYGFLELGYTRINKSSKVITPFQTQILQRCGEATLHLLGTNCPKVKDEGSYMVNFDASIHTLPFQLNGQRVFTI